jgi:hypothetical protein
MKPINIEKAAIEYWNGKAFVRLDINPIHQYDYAVLSSRPKEAEIFFTCPNDMETLELNGIESRWLRFRILEITNTYGGSLVYNVPVVENLTVSYECNAGAPEKMIVKNNLETKIMAGTAEKIKLFEMFPAKEPSLFLGFDKPFGGQPVKFLAEAEGGNDSCVFYLFKDTKWKRAAVTDTTGGFSKTGIITCLFNEQLKATVLFGKKLYWLKAEFDSQKPEKIILKNLVHNATNIQQRPAEMGEETSGNCDANKITRMSISAGYVQSVTNPLPVQGGRLAETSQQLIKRGARGLRHRQRAVTTSDFEALARECAGNLLKCRCFGDSGKITVVYIPDNYPAFDKEAAETLKKYLIKRSHPMFSQPEKLIVRDAVYVYVAVEATLELREYRNPVEAVDEVKSTLDLFLNPITGGFNNSGYDFGEFPEKTKIEQILYDLLWIDKIEKIELHFTQEPEEENLIQFIAILPGQHNINIEFNLGDK